MPTDSVAFGRPVAGQSLANRADGDAIETTASDPNREDQVIRAGLFLDLNFVRMFGVSLGYRYETNITEYTLRSQFDGETIENHFNYDEHRIFATLNLRY